MIHFITMTLMFYIILYSDVTACDSHGKSPLHLVAANKSVKAKKMVSLLLKNGGSTGLYFVIHLY